MMPWLYDYSADLSPHDYLKKIRYEVSQGLSGIASPEAVATSPEFARAISRGDFTAPSRSIPVPASGEPWQATMPADYYQNFPESKQRLHDEFYTPPT